MQGRLLKTLTPVFEVEGQAYAMLTPQLAGISKKLPGTMVVDLAAVRGEITAALDLLMTGI